MLGQDIKIPILKAIITGGQDNVLAIWYFRAMDDYATLGQVTRYETNMENPPSGMSNLEITFASPEEAGLD